MVMSTLIKRGYIVSQVYGVGKPYDLVVDIDGELKRVECKHGRLKNQSVVFNLYSSTKNGRQSSVDKVDYFGVYCSVNNKTYFVPTDHIKSKFECSISVFKYELV